MRTRTDIAIGLPFGAWRVWATGALPHGKTPFVISRPQPACKHLPALRGRHARLPDTVTMSALPTLTRS